MFSACGDELGSFQARTVRPNSACCEICEYQFENKGSNFPTGRRHHCRACNKSVCGRCWDGLRCSSCIHENRHVSADGLPPASLATPRPPTLPETQGVGNPQAAGTEAEPNSPFMVAAANLASRLVAAQAARIRAEEHTAKSAARLQGRLQANTDTAAKPEQARTRKFQQAAWIHAEEETRIKAEEKLCSQLEEDDWVHGVEKDRTKATRVGTFAMDKEYVTDSIREEQEEDAGPKSDFFGIETRSSDCSSCPACHPLLHFETDNEHYYCSRCDADQLQGAQMYGCRVCDFDLCLGCYGTSLPFQVSN